MFKQLKNNYYAILDNGKHCNKEYLSKFEKRELSCPHVSQNPSQAEKLTTKQNQNKKIPLPNIVEYILIPKMWN